MCASVCSGAHGGLKGTLDLLELRVIMSLGVAGNQTPVLLKRIRP